MWGKLVDNCCHTRGNPKLQIVHLIGYSRETKSLLHIFLHWYAGSIKNVLVITRHAVINFSTQVTAF
jgi:hypothetical protein